MKLIVQKNDLYEAINNVQKAVSVKSTSQALEGIYIEASDKLTLIGNNNELSVEQIIDADINEKGSIVVNSKLFGEIIRTLPDAPISLEVTQNFRVKIESLTSYFEIAGIEAALYQKPMLDVNDILSSITITQEKLKDLIKQTIFAAGTDENRKIMTGVLIEAKYQELVFAALDGFRMAVSKCLIKQNSNFKAVVPSKNLNEVIKILENNDDIVTVSYSSNYISFKINNCTITSNLLDGEFMKYESYIPSQFETIIKINRKEFIKGLERACLISSEDKRYPVKLYIKEDTILATSTTDVGVSKDQISIKNEGLPLSIGFNPKYLLDCLKVIEDESIKISFTSAIGPCIITAEEQDNYLYLVLPVRINER